MNNSIYLSNCTPQQIVCLTYPLSSENEINILDSCNNPYDKNSLEYAYSVDSLCWSCYMSYDEFMSNTIDLDSDYFIRIKLSGIISGVNINGNPTSDYSTQLVPGFNLDTLTSTTENTYNPYSNLDSALALQESLAETVSNIVGIPIYYFKLAPDTSSADLTFKEYTLMNVESVKQLKLVIADGQMPSSKPEFSDWGLDFQNDWETEITKVSFATAFGNNAQPMEGDLIYIPLMKRMWMVNGAYEEKNGNLMWQATTFKVILVKYQEKGSVDLNDAESLVQTFVKNKYDDLFGEDNKSTLDSSEIFTEAPKYAAENLYAVYESDALRRYVSCDSVNIVQNTYTYYKGMMISDSKYNWLDNSIESQVIYQTQYCGDALTISFIISPKLGVALFEHPILTIGNINVMISQSDNRNLLYINVIPNSQIELEINNTYFVVIRWSKNMNLFDMSAYKYTYNQNIPIYKLGSNHYYYDIDNPVSKYVSKFDIELVVSDKSQISLHNFYGSITNIKIFDVYNDNISELLQMYPTHQHLMINDTARQIIGKNGVKPA